VFTPPFPQHLIACRGHDGLTFWAKRHGSTRALSARSIAESSAGHKHYSTLDRCHLSSVGVIEVLSLVVGSLLAAIRFWL
jgi:hypothetical protein